MSPRCQPAIVATLVSLAGICQAEQGQSTSGVLGGVAYGRNALGFAVRVEQGYDAFDGFRVLASSEVSRRVSSTPTDPSPVVLQLSLAPAWCFACGDYVRFYWFAGPGLFIAFAGNSDRAMVDLAASSGFGFTWRLGWGWGLMTHAAATTPVGLSTQTDRKRDAQGVALLGVFLEY